MSREKYIAAIKAAAWSAVSLIGASETTKILKAVIADIEKEQWR